MAQLMEFMGGIVIPGTARINFGETYGSEYEVIASVFDSDAFPGQAVESTLVSTPYFSVAEWTCEFANTGVEPQPDLREVLLPATTIDNAFVADYASSFAME